jgi:hypothetical protein
MTTAWFGRFERRGLTQVKPRLDAQVHTVIMLGVLFGWTSFDTQN